MTAGAALSADEAAHLAGELEGDLRRHVVDVWFPRCVDRERGGFLSAFDRRWRPAARQPRMLEFQARQTRALAGLALAYPDDDRWAEWALHGFAYLRDRLWDREQGGWYWLADEDGVPQHGATKHAHGSSYAIGAGAAVYRATGHAEALELALEAVGWIERTHRDDDFGGYHGWVTRDGRWIRSADDAPGGLADPLGVPPEHKNVNVHADLAEAYGWLERVAPDRGLAMLAAGLHELLERRFAGPDGAFLYSFTRRWEPVAQLERFGYGMQWVGRIGHRRSPELAEAVARHALARAWDPAHGGLAFAGPAAPPDSLEGTSVVARRRSWWVQVEALRALVVLACRPSADPLFIVRLRDLAAVVRRDLLDARYGGWLPEPLSEHGVRARLGRRRPAKGTVWKDASHETEMYLASIRLLRGLADDAPLAGRRPTGGQG